MKGVSCLSSTHMATAEDAGQIPFSTPPFPEAGLCYSPTACVPLTSLWRSVTALLRVCLQHHSDGLLQPYCVCASDITLEVYYSPTVCVPLTSLWRYFD